MAEWGHPELGDLLFTDNVPRNTTQVTCFRKCRPGRPAKITKLGPPVPLPLRRLRSLPGDILAAKPPSRSVINAEDRDGLAGLIQPENDPMGMVDEVPELKWERVGLRDRRTAQRHFLQAIDRRHQPSKPALGGLRRSLLLSEELNVLLGIEKRGIGDVNLVCQA